MAEPMDDLEARKQEWHRKHLAIRGQVDEETLLEPVHSPARQLCVDLPAMLGKLREGGYLFGSRLEADLDSLGQRARQVEVESRDQARRVARELVYQLDRLRDGFRSLDTHPSNQAAFTLGRLDSELDDAKRSLDRFEQDLVQATGDLPTRASEIGARLAQIAQYLKDAGGASFSLEPGEALYMAVRAEWEKSGKAKDDPDGILHVTDRRLIMERREKEGGFLGFGGKAVQQVLWEVPWSQVKALRPEQRGLLGGVDLIHFRLDPGSSLGVEELTIEVKGNIDASAFADQLRPALDGTLAGDRLGSLA